MKQFFGDDAVEESNKKNTVNENCLIFFFFLRFSFFVAKKITSPKKEADLVKSIQNTKYNPINGKYY